MQANRCIHLVDDSLAHVLKGLLHGRMPQSFHDSLPSWLIRERQAK